MYAGSSGPPPQGTTKEKRSTTPTSATNASATSTTATPTNARKLTKDESESDDITELEVTSSVLLQKVRDVDGVQLMAKRQSLTDESLRSTSATPKKTLGYEVDPQHYRMLVTGLVPLRSSLMKADLDMSSTSIQRKNVHFSDNSGYDLSFVHSYVKAVRIAYDCDCYRQLLDKL